MEFSTRRASFPTRPEKCGKLASNGADELENSSYLSADGGGSVAGGPSPFVLRQPGPQAIRQGLFFCRVASFEGLAECRHGLGQPAGLGVGGGQTAHGLGAVGLDPEGLAILGHRVVELAAVGQGQAEIVVGLGVVGLESQGLPILRDRLVELAQSGQGEAEVVMGVEVVGPDLQGRP